MGTFRTSVQKNKPRNRKQIRSRARLNQYSLFRFLQLSIIITLWFLISHTIDTFSCYEVTFAFSRSSAGWEQQQMVPLTPA